MRIMKIFKTILSIKPATFLLQKSEITRHALPRSNDSPRTEIRSSFSEPLKILVGPGKPNSEKFFINEELICTESQFFKTACRKSRSSSRSSRKITLPDHDPTIFAIFLSWLLTGDLESSPNFIQIPTSDPVKEGEEKKLLQRSRYAQWEQLRKCYILGDELMAVGFKNAVLDLLITVADYLITEHKVFPCRTVKELEIIYQDTNPGSGLRRLVVDLAVKGLGLESLEMLDVAKPCLAEFWEEMRGRVSVLLEGCQKEGDEKIPDIAYQWEGDSSAYYDDQKGI